MATPFGFSVGDFLATLELVHDVIEALKASGGSSAEFVELMNELYSLERALLQVKHLNVPSSMQPQLAAVRQAAALSQGSIDDFLQKIKKFQPTLRIGGSQHKWKDALHKIQWRLYKKDDVDALRATLRGHTLSIIMLLQSIQL